MHIKSQGFTLAEVLITLTIIGLVAALTIPTMVVNTNKQKYTSAFKKNYAVLSQAFHSLADEHNGNIQSVIDYGGGQGGQCFFATGKGESAWGSPCQENLGKYLNAVRVCTGWIELSPPDQKCWHRYNNWYTLHGDPTLLSLGSGGAVLADGTLITSAYNNIYIDVNGFNPPNTYGIDIFGFTFLNNGQLFPAALDWYDSANTTFPSNVDPTGNCSKTGSGTQCGLSIMQGRNIDWY